VILERCGEVTLGSRDKKKSNVGPGTSMNKEYVGVVQVFTPHGRE